jgi:hypothetical protein
MNDRPMNEQPVNRANSGFWMWVVVLGFFLLFLGWLLRIPWG